MFPRSAVAGHFCHIDDTMEFEIGDISYVPRRVFSFHAKFEFEVTFRGMCDVMSMEDIWLSEYKVIIIVQLLEHGIINDLIHNYVRYAWQMQMWDVLEKFAIFVNNHENCCLCFNGGEILICVGNKIYTSPDRHENLPPQLSRWILSDEDYRAKIMEIVVAQHL